MPIQANQSRLTLSGLQYFEGRDTETGPQKGHEQLATTCALTSMLVALWMLTHRYRGVTGDAELYAVQALARIRSGLVNDLFLQNTSQDRYTLFSPLYAWCIDQLGLHRAALTLTLIFKVWFFAAAWALSRCLWNSRTAYLATACLIVIAGIYGGAGVFRYAEDWVTARSLAEALVITALALFYWDYKVTAATTAASAMLVHPLMALPGLLVITCVWLPIRVGTAALFSGTLAALFFAICALLYPIQGTLIHVMDPVWLDVVKERSEFLFLQLWSLKDWQLNSRPFVSLILTALVVQEPRISRLCLAAILVGVAGLVVNAIASFTAVPELLQGQAWRWLWMTAFIATLLIVPTVRRMLQNDRCGTLCAVLMIFSWVFSPIDKTVCIGLALVLWVFRDRITAPMSVSLKLATVGLIFAMVVWIISQAWTHSWSPVGESGRAPWELTAVRNLIGLDGVAIGLATFFVTWLSCRRSVCALFGFSAIFVGISAWSAAYSLSDPAHDGTREDIEAYFDWRHAVPPGSNVFVLLQHYAASFAWFTLERPNYLSVDQSAGVVFSRATAMEVLRRSQVLQPLMDPNWKLLSNSRAASLSAAAGRSDEAVASRPLTRTVLLQLCEDPQMNFVVAKEDLGFGAIRHSHDGRWKNWNLYDCRRVTGASN